MECAAQDVPKLDIYCAEHERDWQRLPLLLLDTNESDMPESKPYGLAPKELAIGLQLVRSPPVTPRRRRPLADARTQGLRVLGGKPKACQKQVNDQFLTAVDRYTVRGAARRARAQGQWRVPTALRAVHRPAPGRHPAPHEGPSRQRIL
jgi:hypothetical protein